MLTSSQPSLHQALLASTEAKEQDGAEASLREASAPHISIAEAPPPFAPQDDVKTHIFEPNATNLQEIIDLINRHNKSLLATDTLCCFIGLCGCFQTMSGRLFSTAIGKIDIWLDGNKKPHAYTPNKWHLVPNFMYQRLGTYDMASAEPFQQKGVCIIKIETGRVVFANKGGQPIMIVAKNNKTGWYVSTDPGFSFADKITINNLEINTHMASISADYINFESLHLFNVQPNTIGVVSKPARDGVKSEFALLMPGPHSYNSPYMRYLATLPTSVQDEIITETSISTQDGVVLTHCNAVLSYRVKIEEAQNLLLLDVRNYHSVIRDWAKRTMLHEIGNTNYQSYHRVDSSKHASALENLATSSTSVLGPHPEQALEEGAPFRPTLEHKMQQALRKKLNDYGVEVVTFALQSFEPPKAIADQVTGAIAKRTEAHYALQSQQINNQTIIAKAEAEATAINIEAEAIVKAAKHIESSPYAQRLKLADKQASIASAWTGGNARTLLFGAPPSQLFSALNLREEEESGELASMRLG